MATKKKKKHVNRRHGIFSPRSGIPEGSWLPLITSWAPLWLFSNRCLRGEKKRCSSMTDINDVQPLRSTGSTCPSRPAVWDTTATGQGQKEKSGIEAWRRSAPWQVQNLLSSCWYRGIGPVGRFLFPTRWACPIAGYCPGLRSARVQESITHTHTKKQEQCAYRSRANSPLSVSITEHPSAKPDLIWCTLQVSTWKFTGKVKWNHVIFKDNLVHRSEE